MQYRSSPSRESKKARSKALDLASSQLMTLVGLLTGTQIDDRLIDAIRQGFRSAGRPSRVRSNRRANAVIVGADGFFVSRRDQVVGLAARHALPAIYFLREFADIGGLISPFWKGIFHIPTALPGHSGS